MKSLFVTILLFAAALVAFDYFGNPPGKKIIFKSMNVGVVEDAEPAPASDSATATTPETATPAVTSSAPAAPTTPATEAPAMAPTTKAATPAVPEVVKQPVADASGFVPPNFETMDQLTKGWTHIPASAFPRPVTLKKDAAFKMSAGASTIRAGTAVTALAFANGQIQLAPSAASTARAVVSVDDTDLKDLLLAGYERWKVARLVVLKDAHLRRLARAKEAPTQLVAASSASVDPKGMPVRSASGSYQLLIDHLKSGEVTEVKAENINGWGDAAATTWQGKPAWAIPIRADVNTIFGLQPVELQCIVQNGRVTGWFYAGSGEPVP